MDDLLAHCLANGYLLNNCHQLDDGTWIVNLRKPWNEGNIFSEIVFATSFSEALEECITQMADAEYFPDEPVSYGGVTKEPKSKIDLLSLTGLRKPTETVRRRI